MSPEYSFSRSEKLKIAFLADEEWFRALDKWLKSLKATYSFDANFSDYLRSKDLSVKELLDLPNRPSSKIESVNIWAKTDTASLSMELRGIRNSELVTCEVSGDPKDAAYLLQELLKRANDLRQWYTKFTQFVFFGLLGLVSVPLALGVVAIRNLDLKSIKDIRHPSDLELLPLLFVLIFVTVIAVAFAMLAVQWLFPTAVFAIGQGKKRNDAKVRFRFALLWSFLAVIAAGVIVALISGGISIRP